MFQYLAGIYFLKLSIILIEFTRKLLFLLVFFGSRSEIFPKKICWNKLQDGGFQVVCDYIVFFIFEGKTENEADWELQITKTLPCITHCFSCSQ